MTGQSIASRLKRLHKRLQVSNIDAALVTKEANVSYLSGFRGRDSRLLVSPGDNFLITDFRYRQEAREQMPAFMIEVTDGPIHKSVKKITKKLKIKRLGFESNWLSYRDYVGLKGELEGIELVPTFELIEELREIKDRGEIEIIRKAVRIANDIFKQISDFIQVGRMERDAAREIEYFMRQKGAARAAFDIIVASGARSSMPHALTSDKIIRPNELVLVDIGANLEGYNSDLTRTLFLGRMDKKKRQIYRIVLAAQRRSIRRINPGVKISEIDKAARQYIHNQGFGKYFGHRLGHGVGREIHERPSISWDNEGILKAGMIFTVEPAIYIPGWGGIRIEDMVLVTKDGCEVLSNKVLSEETSNQ